MIYHARKREPTLAERVLPTLRDLPDDRPMSWSIFDLACTVPVKMKLKSHLLSAGDLRLTFTDARRLVSVRQIAVAKLALARMPLVKWLAQEQRARSLHYRATSSTSDVCIRSADGRELVGLSRTMSRRLRFFLVRWLCEHLTSAALHDAERDRLLLLTASDRDLLEDVARTVGCR